MKKYTVDNPIKGMLFAGCSFTWGQGLYYYGYSPSLKEPEPHRYDENLIKEPHLSYMYSVRFPRLVSNHFNTFELVQPWNGGSHDKIINWWGQALDLPKTAYSESYKDPYWAYHQKLHWPISLKDISHVVFQMTQPHRCMIQLYKDQTEEISYFDSLTNKKHRDQLEIWLKENNLSEEQFRPYFENKSVQKVKTFLQEIEKAGVKVTVMTWPSENVPLIKNDEWLNSKFLKFKYNGVTYDSIEELMNNPELIIIEDYENFSPPPVDKHPSLLCHRVIADNLIEYLEKEF